MRTNKAVAITRRPSLRLLRMSDCEITSNSRTGIRSKSKFKIIEGCQLPLPPHPVLIRIHGSPGFAIGLTPFLGLPLIPVLFALGNRQFALHLAVFEVKPRGDERMPLDLRLCHEPPNLVLMKQQLPCPSLVVVRYITVRIRSDMHIQKEGFAVFHKPVRVLQVRLSFANRLDLRPTQGHPGLEFLQQEVIVAGGPVMSGVALARRHRVPGLRLLLGRRSVAGYDSVAALARHWGSTLKLSS